MKHDEDYSTVEIHETLVLNDGPGNCPAGTVWCSIAKKCNPIPTAGGSACGGGWGGGGSGWGGVLPVQGGGYGPSTGSTVVAPPKHISTTPPNPPCQPPCIKVPKQCYHTIPSCKITWRAGGDEGCILSWVTVSNFKNAKLSPTVPGDTDYVGPDGSGWNPPFVGPPEAGWNPPLAKNLPEVIAKKIDCDCEVIPDYDPVYAKANLYPGVGIGYQRSKIIIVYTDEMYKNQPDLEECPKREIEYHLHVNRLTERIRINRRTR